MVTYVVVMSCTVVIIGFENDTYHCFHKLCSLVFVDLFADASIVYRSMTQYDNFLTSILSVKSQYLSWPFIFKTSVICLGMLSVNSLAKSWLGGTHSCIINICSLSEFIGFCLSNCILRNDHKFSVGLRSGEFTGHRRSVLLLEGVLIPFFSCGCVLRENYLRHEWPQDGLLLAWQW